MPQIHISNWKNVKSSDFPRFKCLCELCDCGCFERANKRHTKICEKMKKKPGFEDIFDRNAATEESNYRVSFNSSDKKIVKKPLRSHEPAGNIKLGDSSQQLPVSTFNDEFRVWDSHDPTAMIPEKAEVTSKILYPSNQRRHVTTNDELYLNNYGNFKAKQSGSNMFENSFQIDKNNYNKDKGDTKINTVYKKDFFKSDSALGESDFTTNARSQIMTRQRFENEKNLRIGKVKVPMEFKTNNMQDFLKFDSELYKNILQTKNTRLSANVFESSLRPGLKPNDDPTFQSPSIFSSRSSNGFNSSLNRRQSKDSVQSKFTDPDFYRSHDNDLNGNTPDSTYKLDYKNIGVDLCMAKAFRRLENNIY